MENLRYDSDLEYIHQSILSFPLQHVAMMGKQLQKVYKEDIDLYHSNYKASLEMQMKLHKIDTDCFINHSSNGWFANAYNSHYAHYDHFFFPYSHILWVLFGQIKQFFHTMLYLY